MNYRYKSKKEFKNINKILAIIAGVLVLFLVLYFILPKTELAPIIFLPELSTTGYLKVNVDAGVVGDTGIVTLTSECYQLTANTELTQAESIANGLVKKIDFRPNTHDLMKDVLDNLQIKVVMVKIVELKNSTFYSRLILKQGNNIVSLDSRPSDSIALAVRTDSPIYVKEDLMKSEGEYIC
jgi:bifunctional DNase/RNase